MSKVTMTLAISGRAGPYTVIADEALESMLEAIQAADAPRITLEVGERRGPVPILKDTARIEELPGGRYALRAELELPESLLAETPMPVSGAELTEADRAEQMRRLEAGQ